jgi:hypothetical protein
MAKEELDKLDVIKNAMDLIVEGKELFRRGQDHLRAQNLFTADQLEHAKSLFAQAQDRWTQAKSLGLQGTAERVDPLIERASKFAWMATLVEASQKSLQQIEKLQPKVSSEQATKQLQLEKHVIEKTLELLQPDGVTIENVEQALEQIQSQMDDIQETFQLLEEKPESDQTTLDKQMMERSHYEFVMLERTTAFLQQEGETVAAAVEVLLREKEAIEELVQKH